MYALGKENVLAHPTEQMIRMIAKQQRKIVLKAIALLLHTFLSVLPFGVEVNKV